MCSCNFSTNSYNSKRNTNKTNIAPLQIRSGLRGEFLFFEKPDPGMEDLNPGMARSLDLQHLLIKPMKY